MPLNGAEMRITSWFTLIYGGDRGPTLSVKLKLLLCGQSLSFLWGFLPPFIKLPICYDPVVL